ncbi:MAG: hypothetical protein ACRD15_04925 [Vicinamibacterales bacterium]
MRNVVLACMLLVAMSARGSAQDDKPSAKPAQKGDTITVKGCLAGGALEATEADALDGTGLLALGLTFRLTGDKSLMKQLKEKHDRKLVVVKGVLKSDLPHEEGQSRSVGRMRITIGGASPNPNSPYAENRRALPVLEVKSFDGGTTSCAR